MKFNSRQHGFTLVEIIVSVAIFIVVAVVALGALLKIIDANKKSENMKTAITNINFALESMARDLRTGSHYVCESSSSDYGEPGGTTEQPFTATRLSNDPDDGDQYKPRQACTAPQNKWVLAFYSSQVDSVDPSCHLIHAYFFEGFSLFKAEQQTCNTPYTFYPLIYSPINRTDSQNEETEIHFGPSFIRVFTGGTAQPYVQMHFTGTAGIASGKNIKNASPFDIQATASQRIND